jgi:hypothetical protein
MSEEIGYCDKCGNTGIINCFCGGDFCVCGDPEPPCQCCYDGLPCDCTPDLKEKERLNFV